MSGQTIKTTAMAALVLGLAACQAGDETAPETAATLPESTVAAGQGPEPSVGAPPPAGGGIPGSSNDNPAAALPETAPPTTNDTPQ
jgi:hypothetical protein